MPLITCSDGRLHTVGWETPQSVFRTGLPALDNLMPQGLSKAAVHEILGENTRGIRLALVLGGVGSRQTSASSSVEPYAVGREEDCGLWIGGCGLKTPNPQSAIRNPKSASIENRKSKIENPSPLVWCSPHLAPYAPAIAGAGVDLGRFWMVHTKSEADTVWAAAECLRCRGVGAVIAEVERLSTIQARRLQLAAETGGGVGILLRPARATQMHYAAATRWRIRPWPGQRTIQRFKVELIHGHGGHIGQSVFLEVCRETDHVRAVESVADRSTEKTTAALRLAIA